MVSTLCGIDEAGRGPLAGPLVVAGVILHEAIEGLNDSKKLTAKRREMLYERIIECSTYHSVVIEASTIDALGISQVMHDALSEIIQTLQPLEVLFDGNTTFGVPNLTTLVKADATIPSVSAASIVAKVTHDRLILELDALYPHYGFASHMGYGTAQHIAAIQQWGYTPYHRRSFKIKALEPTLF
ncbi:MAG: ribonuclease HII [Sulfurovum sp. PC08-66]|nr:MAG: ribonuclease HII [Sulfurovum sp. PC08-66]KIM12594.1 MAG: ribonuclease HII [Sulfuricurvum sp. PC08-66]